MAAELEEYRRWLIQAYISATFTPFAARTQQYVKEQLGQADEKVDSHTGARLMPVAYAPVLDSIACRLCRAREESGCPEAGPPKTTRSHVRLLSRPTDGL